MSAAFDAVHPDYQIWPSPLKYGNVILEKTQVVLVQKTFLRKSSSGDREGLIKFLGTNYRERIWYFSTRVLNFINFSVTCWSVSLFDNYVSMLNAFIVEESIIHINAFF